MVKDIAAIVEEGAPKKRIRAHLRESELRKLAADHASKLDQLLAIAAYKAEGLRAQAEGRPLDEEAAMVRFEQNPFQWETSGWRSQVEVCFLWTWLDRDGAPRKAFVFSILLNVADVIV